MTKWTVNDIPDLSGRVALVTGANSGLGYETTLALAKRGAQVIMASRTPEKAERAIDRIRQQVPQADLVFIRLDLADLQSVDDCGQQVKHEFSRLDLLINNAGLMAIPYQKTVDGFEMQFGTNHLGHFALTAHVLPLLLLTPGSRVVTVSSGYHRMGTIRFDDLNWTRDYQKWQAYAQSKLANLLFMRELQHRLSNARADCISLAAHPGYAATDLQHKGPRMTGNPLEQGIMNLMNTIVAQSAEMGALPQLYAATAPGLQGGEYIGPDGLMEMRGYPEQVAMSEAAQDDTDAKRLWKLSEELTAVQYAFPETTPVS